MTVSSKINIQTGKTTDLKDYRLMINQMYTCSIVDIIRQGPKEYSFKPIEILQYSKKIADCTMFKPTGSVVVLSETGEISFWNGGESIRMLHKPQSEVPKYGMYQVMINNPDRKLQILISL